MRVGERERRRRQVSCCCSQQAGRPGRTGRGSGDSRRVVGRAAEGRGGCGVDGDGGAKAGGARQVATREHKSWSSDRVRARVASGEKGSLSGSAGRWAAAAAEGEHAGDEPGLGKGGAGREGREVKGFPGARRSVVLASPRLGSRGGRAARQVKIRRTLDLPRGARALSSASSTREPSDDQEPFQLVNPAARLARPRSARPSRVRPAASTSSDSSQPRQSAR